MSTPPEGLGTKSLGPTPSEKPTFSDPYRVRGALPSWIPLPGDAECGGEFASWWCPEGQEVRHLKSACWKVGCDRDMTTWAAREARRAVDCFKRAEKAGALKGRLWHVMIVPPLGTLDPTEDALDAFKRLAYRIYEAHELRGGCVVAHYCQKTHPGVYWPHVHAIGPVYGRYKPGPYCVPCEGPASDACRQDARHETWVIKFVKVRGRGLMRQVAAILRYELGHALRREGKHALTWFGTLSYGKRKTWDPPAVEAREYEPPTCPEHGCDLVPIAPWDATNYDRMLALGDRPPPPEVWE